MIAAWYNYIPAPTIWAGISLVLGSSLTLVLMFLVNKRFGPLQATALNNLVGVYEKQIAANERTVEMQKAHYEVELGDMKKERDTYRDKLHDANDLAHNQALKIQELETRPNLSNLETLMQSHTEAVEKIGVSLEVHMESDKKFFTQFGKALNTIAKRTRV